MDHFSAEQICFGLNPALDRQSICCFLQLIGRREFAEALAERMTSQEIDSFVTSFTGLLKAHLSEDEYHRLFLNQPHSPHSSTAAKEAKE